MPPHFLPTMLLLWVGLTVNVVVVVGQRPDKPDPPFFISAAETSLAVGITHPYSPTSLTDQIVKIREVIAGAEVQPLSFQSLCRGLAFGLFCDSATTTTTLYGSTTYEFYSQFRNSEGWSSRSDIVAFSTLTDPGASPPGPPQGFFCNSLSTTSIQVSWASHGSGGAVTRLFGKRQTDAAFSIVCTESSQTDCTLTSLDPGTKYRFFAQSGNEGAGYGEGTEVIACWTHHSDTHCGVEDLSSVAPLFTPRANSMVVDMTANYYVRTDPLCDDGSLCDRALFDNFFERITSPSGIAVNCITAGSTELGILNQKNIVNARNHILIEDLASLEAIWKAEDDQYAVCLYVQTHPPLGGVANYVETLSRWQSYGLLVLQLAYGSGSNQGVDEKLGGGTNEVGGLTDLGRLVVPEMNRINMIVDVSHCNDQTTLEACQLSTAPVIATHANVAAIYGIDRNKADFALQAIADTGGLIGIMPLDRFLSGQPTATIHDFIAHLNYLVALVGIDHVGLATDGYIDGQHVSHAGADDSGPYLSSWKRWQHVACFLKNDHGYSDDDLEKILGGNFYRVVKEVLTGTTDPPSHPPTDALSDPPTLTPSIKPTVHPTNSLTIQPSNSPTSAPTLDPPSVYMNPSGKPSNFPSLKPSHAPSSSPSVQPSMPPSSAPTKVCTLPMEQLVSMLEIGSTAQLCAKPEDELTEAVAIALNHVAKSSCSATALGVRMMSKICNGRRRLQYSPQAIAFEVSAMQPSGSTQLIESFEDQFTFLGAFTSELALPSSAATSFISATSPGDTAMPCCAPGRLMYADYYTRQRCPRDESCACPDINCCVVCSTTFGNRPTRRLQEEEDRRSGAKNEPCPEAEACTTQHGLPGIHLHQLQVVGTLLGRSDICVSTCSPVESALDDLGRGWVCGSTCPPALEFDQ